MSSPEAGEASRDIEPIFKRVLKNAGRLLGGRTVNAVLSLAYLALAARTLGVEAFGALVLIQAFAQVLSDVITFQSWQTVLQYGAAPLEQGRLQAFHRIIRFSAFLDGVSGLIGVLIGTVLAVTIGDKLGWSAANNSSAALYTLTILVSTASTSLGLLRLFDRFDFIAGQAVVIAIVRFIGCGVGFVLHAQLGFFLLVWGLATLAGFLFLVFGVLRELKRRDLLKDFSLIGPINVRTPGVWRFAMATNLNATLGTAFTHVITLMVGGFLGPAQSALWRVGWQVSNAISKPAKLLTPALYPEFARLRTNRGEATMVRLAWRFGIAAGAIGAVLLCVSAFAGPFLLSLIMGPGFASAAGVMTWQVGAAAIGLLALPLEPLVISQGHATAAVRVRVIVALVFLATLPAVIMEFGVNAVGAGLIVATLSYSAGLFWLAMRGTAANQITEMANDALEYKEHIR